MKHRSERIEIQVLEEIEDVLERIAASIAQLVALLSRPFQAETAVLKGPAMPVEVGSTETATLTFVDASGAEAAPPAGDDSGLVVTIASDNEAVATVGATTASGDTAVAEVTGVSAGDYNLTATVANSSGAALLDDDGTTAFVQPNPLADSVTAPPPPQATTAVLSVG